MKVEAAGINTGTDLFTWAEVKAFLRIRVDNDESRIMDLMRAAVNEIEKRSNHVLVKRQFTIYLNDSELCDLEGGAVLPVLQIDPNVAPTLSYFSGISAGVQQWTAYTDFYITTNTPPRLRLGKDASLPDTYDDKDEWRLVVTAGYDDGDCPDALKYAVLLRTQGVYTGNVDMERLIENQLAPLKIHGNSF